MSELVERTRHGGGRCRHRPGPWTVLVVGSTVVLVAAALLARSAVVDVGPDQLDVVHRAAAVHLAPYRDPGRRGERGDRRRGHPEVLVDRVDSSAFGHWPTEKRFVADGVFRIESSCPTW